MPLLLVCELVVTIEVWSIWMVFWFDSVIGDCSVGTTGVVGLSGWSGGGLSTYFRQGISCQFVCSWTRSHSPSSPFNTSPLPGRNLYFLLTSTCLPTVVSFPIVEDTTDAVAARRVPHSFREPGTLCFSLVYVALGTALSRWPMYEFSSYWDQDDQEFISRCH